MSPQRTPFRLRKRPITTLLLLALLSSPGLRAQEAIRLMANAPGAQTPDAAMLRQAIKGKVRSWASGDAITVVLPGKNSPDYDLVAKACFGLSGKGMQREWLKLVFSGKANAPIYAESPEQLMELIAANPGSIGVTSLSPLSAPGVIVQTW